MARLIDADALLEELCDCCSQQQREMCKVDPVCGTAMRIIEAPAVDAVSVVRCKDCKHYKEDTLTCIPRLRLTYEHPNWYPEDFCSYGERRTDG